MSASDPQRLATLMAGGVAIRVAAPASLLATVLGPLATLRGPAAGTASLDVVASTEPLPKEALAAAGPTPLATGAFADGPGGPWLVAPGLGGARVPREGPVTLYGAASAPVGDAFAERVTIPALAEALRRRGVRLIHAAVLLRRGGGAWLVPARKGGGKTTLSLSLRGRGYALLSDDRAFLAGPPDAPVVFAWPEAPRVGDRSLFLLPPGVAPGPRDERTGKSLVPSLLPPRLSEPVPVAGFLIPRLVEGPGGTTALAFGARALSALAAEAVVATDPTTASETLAYLAKMLERLPVLEVDVGDDPARIAAAVLDDAMDGVEEKTSEPR